jgi:hypothetical protein
VNDRRGRGLLPSTLSMTDILPGSTPDAGCPSNRVRPRPFVADERVQIARSDADMPTELGVSDTPLKDQPAYEPRRRAQPVSSLLHGQ